MLRSVIDFAGYLRRLVDQFEKPGFERPGEPALADYYVELQAEVPGDQKHPGWKGRASVFIKTWLENPSAPPLALLGEYGSGKTTISQKLARDLAERYLRGDVKTDERIPVLISLRDFPRVRQTWRHSSQAILPGVGCGMRAMMLSGR